MGVLTLDRLWRSGVFAELWAWFPIVRPRGFGVEALFAVAVLYLVSGVRIGIRPFLERLDRRQRRRLGALVGQRTLPTAGSLSRALGGFCHDEVRAFVSQALGNSLDETLLAHPSVQHHDSQGEGWHVADIDPTVMAIRRRDLPDDPEMTHGKRRAKGEPGYTGRKRGEARMRVVPVLHDGVGQWLAMVLLPEEGSIVPALRTLSQEAVDALVAKRVRRDRLILRGDGELGSAGALRAMMDSGAWVLTRLARNGLLRRELVVKTLPQVHWYPVAPGESGVPREAAELGTFTLHGSNGAEDPAAEVTVRVIVTRMPRTSAPDHGIVVDKFQLELFATTLDAASWAAPDVVKLFHGRSSIENRFAQEDREFDLARNFSFHAPGQEWMVGVGMFLWNEQVVAGFRESGLPEMSAHRVDRSLVAKVDQPKPAPPESQAATLEIPATSAAEVDSHPVDLPTERDAQIALHRTLERAFHDVTCWAGWSLEVGGIRCEQGRLLRPYSAVAPKAGAPRMAVKTEPRACDGCPVRHTCFGGDGTYKQISRVVSVEDLAKAQAAMAQLRGHGAPMRRRGAAVTRERAAEAQPLSTAPVVFVPPVLVAPGPLVPQPPRFLPAEARHQVRKQALGVDVRLTVRREPRSDRHRHRLLNRDAADRAHRRRTMQEARAKWSCERPASVRTRPLAGKSPTSSNFEGATI